MSPFTIAAALVAAALIVAVIAELLDGAGDIDL